MQRWKNITLTGVNEDRVHIEFSTDGAKDEAAGRTENQCRKEDSCIETNISFNIGFGLISYDNFRHPFILVKQVENMGKFQVTNQNHLVFCIIPIYTGKLFILIVTERHLYSKVELVLSERYYKNTSGK